MADWEGKDPLPAVPVEGVREGMVVMVEDGGAAKEAGGGA